MKPQRDSKPVGIVWPEGRSAEIVQAALAASVAGIDDEGASKVKAEKNWRNNYMPHLVNHVEACLTSSDAALQVSKQGLAFLYQQFTFVNENGNTMTIQDAMSSPKMPCPFYTATVQGVAASPTKVGFGTVKVPFSFSLTPGKPISGLDLELELVRAAAQGLMEPSVIEAVRQLNVDQSWCNKLGDTCFVALGGGAAMGQSLTCFLLVPPLLL